MRAWWKRNPKDVEGIEDSRRRLEQAHEATADIVALTERLEARRRENRFGRKIHAALQGEAT